REVEGVEGPAEPGGPPSEPLLPRRLLPPRNGFCVRCRCRHACPPFSARSSVSVSRRRQVAPGEGGRSHPRFLFGLLNEPITATVNIGFRAVTVTRFAAAILYICL